MTNEQVRDSNSKSNEEVTELTENETSNKVIKKLEEELAITKDKILRLSAEIQNIRRRADQDVEKAHKFSLERFILDLLPVLDSLERSLDLSSSDDEKIRPMREGIELTLKSFQDTLKRFNLEVINPMDEFFDANYHQAMAVEERTDHQPNKIIKVFQKGYKLNGRSVRPAMVIVSKLPEMTSPVLSEEEK